MAIYTQTFRSALAYAGPKILINANLGRSRFHQMQFQTPAACKKHYLTLLM